MIFAYFIVEYVQQAVTMFLKNNMWIFQLSRTIYKIQQKHPRILIEAFGSFLQSVG